MVCRAFRGSVHNRPSIRAHWLLRRYGPLQALPQGRFYPFFDDAVAAVLVIRGALVSRGDGGTLRWLAVLGYEKAVDAWCDRNLTKKMRCDGGKDKMVNLGEVQSALDTCLAAASASGRLELVKKLLRFGANVHAEHDTALRLAGMCNNMTAFKSSSCVSVTLIYMNS
jgi:hypothetical protein